MKKTILITGASSGIGEALAYELADRGWALALTARSTEKLERLRDNIKKAHPDLCVEIRTLDVTDYDRVPVVIKDLAVSLDGLDVACANAGTGILGEIGKDTFTDARHNIEVNVIGAMATVDAAIAHFFERGRGHIVGMSSFAAFRGMPQASAYCASKAAFATYLEALRAEVYYMNIDVTVLYPGYIDTPMNRNQSHRPFLIPVDKGARIISDMIEKKVKSSTVPVFPWNVLAHVYKMLPTRYLAKKQDLP